MISPFVFSSLPRIVFGAGAIQEAPRLVADFGTEVLLVTGASAVRKSGRWDALLTGLEAAGIGHRHVSMHGEPSPEQIDTILGLMRNQEIDVVLAWGGGSVLDAGKAISAMLPLEGSVFDYLEDVGTGATHPGDKTPFIAVPTTAGTGSEATKNAVLSRVGPQGFKKSLRHDRFMPDVALIDPELALTCPPPVTAACGLDALTQLLEAFVSTKASPLTDALARSGLAAVRDNLTRAFRDGAQDVAARGGMAYAALLSGVTLANAGLGLVHGLAGPLGGFFPVPHGVACGTLLAPANAATIRRLRETAGPAHPALAKFAEAGRLLAGRDERDSARAADLLVETLAAWTEELQVPRLSAYGITAADLPRLAAAGDNKNNPVALSAEERQAVLAARL